VRRRKQSAAQGIVASRLLVFDDSLALVPSAAKEVNQNTQKLKQSIDGNKK
jgi:hypothetical protein